MSVLKHSLFMQLLPLYLFFSVTSCFPSTTALYDCFNQYLVQLLYCVDEISITITTLDLKLPPDINTL